MEKFSIIFFCSGTRRPPPQYIYYDSWILLRFEHLIPYWLVWMEIECRVHFALPKRPINLFQPVQKSKRQAIRVYGLNIYTGTTVLAKCILQMTSLSYVLSKGNERCDLLLALYKRNWHQSVKCIW